MDGSHALRCLDSPVSDRAMRKAHIYKINASQGQGQVVERYVISFLCLPKT